MQRRKRSKQAEEMIHPIPPYGTMPVSNHDPEANETRFSEMLSSVEVGKENCQNSA